ncbi:oligoendopeptidase [Alicyclobacillus sacchari]|uniref:M3 family oligoendopeptidase n=1 Tax=Alicyclobacillus sacchari TaxID=392010 RepID=UPI0023E9C2B1|nr:M3 family oligoendopeptidase [Alicyclobacillus sacchari]GMA58376.1 oligoendopeptidase [Alicyclobacillus sacchari]
MTHSSQQTWDLDVIFAGGSKSHAFRSFLDDLDTRIQRFTDACASLVQGSATPTALAQLVLDMQDIAARTRESGAFISCLTAQNVRDTDAKLLLGRLQQMRAAFASALTTFNELLTSLNETAFSELLAQPGVSNLKFPLMERIERAKEQLPAPEEKLIAKLSVDGYNAWGELYDTIVGRMHADIEIDGQPEQVSMGQLANRIASAQPDDRETLFAIWEKTWADEADLCADALNHLAGYRLAVYNARGWTSVLKEPLAINRMSESTLNAMWGVIEQNKEAMVRFLQAKARLLRRDKLRWEDIDAPLGEAASHKVSYDEARAFIVRHFGRFSDDMARFADACFEKRWIESEDRPGKRPGGFCTSFPVSQQTRIFVTFSGTPGNVATLAHELGHAYHQHVMRGLPQLLSNYAMNVAETASTFAEAIVSDAAIREAETDGEKLALLDEKIGRAVAMLMNIHARFLFETRFYEERRKGFVKADRLNELMVAAQREAYQDALASYHPHFWASKLHFYITGTPFYNFPYTFGYLFSSGIYAQALREGPTFADKYVALLRDTGRMSVEDLAAKHLGVSLKERDFWQSAVDLAATDVDMFIDLANKFS